MSSHSSYQTEESNDKFVVREAAKSGNYRKESIWTNKNVPHFNDNSFRQEEFSEVEEADEQEEFDIPIKSSRFVNTHFHVINSAEETPNIDEHMQEDLNSNLNLLFYNFNGSRAKTAAGRKRDNQIGFDRSFHAEDKSKNAVQIEQQMMYCTDAFPKIANIGTQNYA